MRRLLLVRHAPTPATRDLAFGADASLDARGRAAAAGLRARGDVLSSPARCCVETAEAAGLAAPVTVAALAECDYGTWAGRSIDALAPADAHAWRTDPASCPHGGESLADFAARVGGWIDEQLGEDGQAVAITHAGVIRAAVVHALGAPLEAFWQIDVAPLSVTELHSRNGGWAVTRVNAT